jgi:hypothetical protein
MRRFSKTLRILVKHPWENDGWFKHVYLLKVACSKTRIRAL